MKKYYITFVLLALTALLFWFVSNSIHQNYKTPSITEELSARFKSFDKNLAIQKQDSKMWWDNNDGYSLMA